MQNLRRGHYELAVDQPVHDRVRNAFSELTPFLYRRRSRTFAIIGCANTEQRNSATCSTASPATAPPCAPHHRPPASHPPSPPPRQPPPPPGFGGLGPTPRRSAPTPSTQPRLHRHGTPAVLPVWQVALTAAARAGPDRRRASSTSGAGR